MASLWTSNDPGGWSAALERYRSVIENQGVDGLPDHDRWYQTELPAAIATREPGYITHDELVRVTRWKMARGVWRARNLALVRQNDPDAVIEASRSALERIPDPRKPIAELSRLAGVGPATASAIAAAAAPEHYPFFDELVAAQVPELGKVAYTPGYYARYADALRSRSELLGKGWTPALVEQALWSHAGGKAGWTPGPGG